ncbi:MAG: undecaprenyl-phosphate glucose phosphotransferase [Chloroflexota bacterium]
MTLDNPSRLAGGNKGARSTPRLVAASNAPVAEPRTGNGKTGTHPRPLTPEEATKIARTSREDRENREGRRKGQPAQIPSLPPAPHAPIRFTPVALVLLQTLTDIITIAGAFGLAYWLRFRSDIIPKYTEPDNPTYATMLGVTVTTVIITFYFSKLYNLKRGASRVDEFYKIAAAVSMGTVLSLAINSLILGDNFVYSRQMLLIGWLMAIGFVTAGRILYSIVVGELRKHGVDRARVLVVGTGPTANTVVAKLDRHRALGYKVVGMVSESYQDDDTPQKIGRVSVLGNLSNLADIVRREKVDEVMIAVPGASDRDLHDILGLLQDDAVSVKIYPDASQLMAQYEVSVGELSGLPLLSVKDVALRGWNRRLKRTFDIVFSAIVLVLVAPIMLLIALAVKLNSPGPVFFIHERVGLDGQPFPLVKFRSMRTDADPAGWTTENDPRRTAVGTFIRRFSLDELPQFYNVLIGEMSVVGPRPEQPEYVKEFAQKIGRDYLLRHREKAGMTGWAQVNGLRGDSSIVDRMRADIYYVENWSLLLDLKIIVRTLVAMFKGKNAY